jgi:hypothetical protein
MHSHSYSRRPRITRLRVQLWKSQLLRLSTSCQFFIPRRFASRQCPRRPIHKPLFPFYDQQITLPWTPFRKHSHASSRVHHIVEMGPLVIRAPFPIRGNGRIRYIRRERRQMSSRLYSLSSSRYKPRSSHSRCRWPRRRSHTPRWTRTRTRIRTRRLLRVGSRVVSFSFFLDSTG